jgi:hypothetical protein
MKRYLYTELHDIFFGNFPIILTKWLEILVENTGRYRTFVPRNSNPELVRKLNYVSNNTSCANDFWLSSILVGYIVKFAIDCTQSYSVIEMDFFRGPHGRFINSLSTWINMFLCDQCERTTKGIRTHRGTGG